MIYLCNSEQGSMAVYLDLHALERQERCFALSGTLGDGNYEGEVVVEVGLEVEVTFADMYLDRCGLESFFQRVDRSVVETALAEAARAAVQGKGRAEWAGAAEVFGPHCASSRPRPLQPTVACGEAHWCASA